MGFSGRIIRSNDAPGRRRLVASVPCPDGAGQGTIRTDGDAARLQAIEGKVLRDLHGRRICGPAGSALSP